MNQLYVVIAGVMIGGILIVVMPLLPSFSKPKKLKVDDDIVEPVKPQIQPQVNNENLIEQRQQAKERKEKLFRNLNVEDRKLVEDYFNQKARDMKSGEMNKSDRRLSYLFTLLKWLIYGCILFIFWVVLTIGLGTQDTEELIFRIKLIIQEMMKKLLNRF